HSSFACSSFLSLPPPRPPLFPYTTLFRSWRTGAGLYCRAALPGTAGERHARAASTHALSGHSSGSRLQGCAAHRRANVRRVGQRDRKSTRLNSSHVKISYAVFCLKKKTTE